MKYMLYMKTVLNNLSNKPSQAVAQGTWSKFFVIKMILI